MRNYLITGALGFIGSNFVNHLVTREAENEGAQNCSHKEGGELVPALEAPKPAERSSPLRVVVLDKMDYCSSLSNIIPSEKVEIVIGKISNAELVSYLLETFEIDTVVHFAASTHVDNSFLNSVSFSKNNIVGTHVLLECCRMYQEKTGRLKKFLHISTDEVYGEVADGEIRTENSILDPTNPYAASKAGAEFMVKSYLYSYKLPVIITRGNNVYGPRQYPEKVIPKFICQLLNGQRLTIHGTGKTKRNFIHVDDVVKAVDLILSKGVVGQIYNISSCYDNEYTVMEIARMLVGLFHGEDEPVENHLVFVEDRHFNDYRYCISQDKLKELGWEPTKTDVRQNLIDLIKWYRERNPWPFP